MTVDKELQTDGATAEMTQPQPGTEKNAAERSMPPLMAEQSGQLNMDGIFADDKERQSIIEAVLFTLGRAVSPSELAKACGCDTRAARAAAKRLSDAYAARNGAVLIRELDGSYQMCTNPRYYDHLIRLVSAPKKPVLTEVVMETLSIIACKHPTTKVEIEKIRGVKSDHAVNKLIEYGLVEETGRLDAPGRPALFAPTEEFYRRFGVSSSAELPTVGPEAEEEIREAVQEEISTLLQEPNEKGDRDGAGGKVF